MPSAAPLLTGLNNATLYVGVSIAPPIGRAGIAWLGAHWLGPVGAALIALGLIAAETAHVIIRRDRAHHTHTAHAEPASALAPTTAESR
ncbi:hypothetical protein ACWDBD_31995 [Streptomyces sp. NPDC001118]